MKMFMFASTNCVHFLDCRGLLENTCFVTKVNGTAQLDATYQMQSQFLVNTFMHVCITNT